MKKTGVVIVGFGNIGQSAVKALEEANDLELLGVVERTECLEVCRKQLPEVLFTDSIDKINGVDIAILCLPSMLVPEMATSLLQKGISTVDCFDMHGDDLIKLKAQLQQVSIENGAVSISAAGWDPGTDSIIRVILEVAAPKGITYTNFGPGR